MSITCSEKVTDVLQEHTTICLAGDVMTGRGIDQVMHHPCSPELYEEWVRDAREYVQLAEKRHGHIPRPVPAEYIWGEALASITSRSSALRLVNLETAVTTHTHPWPAKGIHYRMHPLHVNALQAAHIHVCNLANNHVMDWGAEGLLETLTTLQNAGLETAGAGIDQAAAQRPAVWLGPRGKRWLIFAWASIDSGVPHPWQATLQRPGVQTLEILDKHTASQISQTVRRYRQAGDRVIVSLHWGENWGWAVPEAQQAFAHHLIDSGEVDLVYGHSSHHPRPIEVYQSKLILYGCGDLINDYEGIGHRVLSASGICPLYFATLSNSTGELLQLEIQPWKLEKFRLVRADSASSTAFLELFNSQSCSFRTRIDVQADSRWTLSWNQDLPMANPFDLCST